MRWVTTMAFLAAALLSAGPQSAALAAGYDGLWSVLIITEKGDCDRGYRYSVNVSKGRVNYAGDASVDMRGTVSPNGAIKVSIRLGEKGADGAGRLSGNTGGGTWHGAAANNSCAGRWEAERR